MTFQRATRTSPPIGKEQFYPMGQRRPLQQPRDTPWRANSSAMGSMRGRPLPSQKGYGAPLARSSKNSLNSRGSNSEVRTVERSKRYSNPTHKSQAPSPPPSYADVARNKKQPSKCLTHMQPKQKQKTWQDRTKKPTKAFWEQSISTQREWIFRRPHWSQVRWILDSRQRQWQHMASQKLQTRLLQGEDQMFASGVIYALILHKSQCIYIGQTVNSVWHRWKQHVFAKWKTGVMERQLQNELQNCGPSDVSVIPLEIIPMSEKARQGHHTPEFIEEFRRRALPREQQWIRIVKGAKAKILNVVREAPKKRTEKRRERRAQAPKPIPKKEHNEKSTMPTVPQKWVFVEEDKIILDSTTPGSHHRIRKSLAQLLRDQSQGIDPIDRLTTWSKAYRRDITLFLMDQLDEQEVNTEKSRVLFKFLSTAEDTKTPPKAPDSCLPDIDTRPKQQAKRNQANETLWIRVPWSRKDFQQIKLDQIMQSQESKKAHPTPDSLKRTKISYSLNRPLGTFFSNVVKVCQECDGQPLPPCPPPTECPCKRFQTPFSLTFNGHVVTTDPGVFHDQSLKQLWQCGRKFRIPAHPAVLLPDVKKGLTEFTERMARIHKMDGEKFQPWIDFVLHKVEHTVSKISEIAWLTNGGLTQQGYKELQHVQKSMVIGHCDKSAHDMMLICKNAYLHALANEFQSGVYQQVALSDEQIWDNHANYSNQIGRIPVKSHSYLYGAAKMHKEPSGMRWIAGCSLQIVERQGERTFSGPATSISPIAAALGAILRFCMIHLERKDMQLFRPKGIRRYWIVTSVDTVARHIKVHQKELAQEQVITEDFTTMYTKLPPEKIKSGVRAAVQEAFDFFDADATFNLKWARDGKAEVVFDDKGSFCKENVYTWIEQVVDGTYIKPSPQSPTYRQTIGVPMGGKCSSELANLYCYSVESQTIDHLLTQGSLNTVKSMYHIFRYIDDILCFGQNLLHLFPYNMEHRRTNDTPQQAVFLGMSIDTSGDFVKLKLQPKGAGWKWVPQRYVEWNSVHTDATKNHLLKGLLVRAGTVTNTLSAFHEAVDYYVQGLFARGFTRRAMHHAFQSYIHDYWNPFPHQQAELSKWFQNLLNQKFEASSAQQKSPILATMQPKDSLLCGLHAINHIMVNQGRMPITREILDDLADNVATLEATISNEATCTMPHEQGNYHVTVMSIALKQLTDLFVQIWAPGKSDDSTPVAFVIGNGSHWQAIVQEPDGWYVRDHQSFKVHNLTNYLQVCRRRGLVLSLLRMPSDSADDMDWDNTSQNRKRLRQEGDTTDAQPTPRITSSSSAPILISEEDGDEHARAYAKISDEPDSATQEILVEIAQTDIPQPDLHIADQPANSATQWVEMTMGVTRMFYNDAHKKFKCAFCNVQRDTALGVATHTGRYCSQNPAKTSVKAEEEEEDII